MEINITKDRKKTRISASRSINTSSFLSSISRDCLKRAEDDINGRSLMLAASIVFSAFKLEAFFNHIGPLKIPSWSLIERKITPIDKLLVISDYLGVNVDFGKAPFQTVKRMFRFRDALAHGKSQELNEETIQYLEEGEIPTLPMTDWEKEISIDNAKLFKNDVSKIIELVCQSADIDFREMFIGSEHIYTKAEIKE
jgi:hypothetical protein